MLDPIPPDATRELKLKRPEHKWWQCSLGGGAVALVECEGQDGRLDWLEADGHVLGGFDRLEQHRVRARLWVEARELPAGDGEAEARGRGLVRLVEDEQNVAGRSDATLDGDGERRKEERFDDLRAEGRAKRDEVEAVVSRGRSGTRWRPW